MSREAFESFHCGGDARLTRRDNHGYVSLETHDAWEEWQAARAAALEEAEYLCRQMFNRAATADECADAIRALKEKE